MDSLPRLTIICPVYNEEATIPLFFERIHKVADQLKDQYETNLLFVDNNSQDHTSHTIRRLRSQHPTFVYIITLSRNFGYQCSVECGLRNAKGDLFVTIDVDCEDPPELIPQFLRYWKDGFEIVYGERLDREESRLLKSVRKAFYRLTRSVADDYFVLDMAEFCLITAEVRDAVMEDNNSFPFIRASIGRVGFRRKNIPYKRHHRIAGKTHYNLVRMTVFAIAGILSSSTFPLRFPAYAFPVWAALIAGLGVAFGVTEKMGYLAALLSVGILFCGFTLVGISIYAARIYKNGFLRPNYIMRKAETFLQPSMAEGKPARAKTPPLDKRLPPDVTFN